MALKLHVVLPLTLPTLWFYNWQTNACYQRHAFCLSPAALSALKPTSSSINVGALDFLSLLCAWPMFQLTHC